MKDVLERASMGLNGANFLEFHLEGPFVSWEKWGMIQGSSICEPSTKVLSEIMGTCGGWLKIMTIAPELKGSEGLIELLLKNGVIVSFGHSSADYDRTMRAIGMGVKHVMYLFNAMQPLHHRNPGPLLAIFESNDVTVQVMSDGVHIHPSVVSS